MSSFTGAQWSEYLAKTGQLPAHSTCQLASKKCIETFKEDQVSLVAVDLGCGAGRDLSFLVSQGFYVHAVDSNEDVFQIHKPLVEMKKASLCVLEMENFVWLSQKVHLINASASLPFVNPDKFQMLWQKISNNLLPQGYFSGHFFGKNDSWSKKMQMSFHSKTELEIMFEAFEIILFQEEEYDGPSGSEILKHWHRFNIVAKKK